MIGGVFRWRRGWRRGKDVGKGEAEVVKCEQLDVPQRFERRREEVMRRRLPHPLPRREDGVQRHELMGDRLEARLDLGADVVEHLRADVCCAEVKGAKRGAPGFQEGDKDRVAALAVETKLQLLEGGDGRDVVRLGRGGPLGVDGDGGEDECLKLRPARQEAVE